jgi:molybdenum cofactor biosynthesis enzyme MoaA
MRLGKIQIFPIKSSDGLSVGQTQITYGGILANDRIYAIFDQEGRVVNGKRTARVHELRRKFDAEIKEIQLWQNGGSSPTQFYFVAPVLRGIKLVKELGFESVKLNTVLMRGRNDGEVFRLLDFAAEHDIAIRFIELMPVSLTEMLGEKNFFPVTELLALLRREDELEPLNESFGFGPAKYFRLKQRAVTVGLIGALSDLHFCERCNKMRLTCDGKLRPCLGNHLETDLKPALRPQIDAARLQELIKETFTRKPAEHLFRNNYQPQRVMTAIGG